MKQIKRPAIENAQPMTPMQLNNVKILDKHTIITPELLKQQQPGAIQTIK